MRQGCLGTGSKLAGRVVAAARVAYETKASAWRGPKTYLLASTRVERHDHSVHERDVKLFGEVEDALEQREWEGDDGYVARHTSMMARGSMDALGEWWLWSSMSNR